MSTGGNKYVYLSMAMIIACMVIANVFFAAPTTSVKHLGGGQLSNLLVKNTLRNDDDDDDDSFEDDHIPEDDDGFDKDNRPTEPAELRESKDANSIGEEDDDDVNLRRPRNLQFLAIDRATNRGRKQQDEKDIPASNNEHMTYEQCSTFLDKFQPRKQVLFDPYWLHFPKCGTSFGLTLHNYACVDGSSPEAAGGTFDQAKHRRRRRRRRQKATEENNKEPPSCTCNDVHRWDPTIQAIIKFEEFAYCSKNVDLSKGWLKNHIPPPRKSYSDYAGKVVAMFRDPRRRLVSAYNHGKHCFGLPFYMATSLRAIPNIQGYINFPSIKSCMTKMVLGHLCASSTPVTPEGLIEAKRRVREDFAFIGLQEFWNESVCLFHRMFGGTMREYAFQNSRAHAKANVGTLIGSKRAGNATYVAEDYWKNLKREDDPQDYEVYQEAVKVFWSNMKAYGLRPKNFKPEDTTYA